MVGTCVSRRTGGLETSNPDEAFQSDVSRRTGGLEK